MPLLLEPWKINARIQAVVLDVAERLARGETAFPIGALSADERERWAEASWF
jgi:carnitine O-acetyltransferase